jgi:hypothetical protein
MRGMNTRKYLLAAAVAVLGAMVWQASAKDFTAPAKWKGTDGETTGNPQEVGGKPMWRAQWFSGDPMSFDSYKDSKWVGKSTRWTGEGEGAAVIVQPNLAIGGAGKNAGVLLFIAPADGTYTLLGSATVTAWKGSLCDKIVAVKINRTDKKVTEVASVPVAATEDGGKTSKPVDLTAIKAELKAGEELGIFLTGMKGSSGCNAKLTDFGVTDGAATSRPAGEATSKPATSGPASKAAGKGGAKAGGKKKAAE